MDITLIRATILSACVAFAVACDAPVGHRGELPDATGPQIDGPRPPDAAITPRSCQDAFQHGVVTDGVVTIDPDGPSGQPAFDVYCNMTTAGGGWTLVWAYGFTNYNNFSDSGNAVTPRPSWSYASSSGTPVSTTIPTSPGTPGAMDFVHWQDFGTELLVTSTINHWIQCTAGTGSLVTQTSGSLACQVVKVVPNKCTTTAPDKLISDSQGPDLVTNGNSGNKYYYFDGSTNNNWPTHDPCGTNSENQLTGVADPGGAIYVRGL